MKKQTPHFEKILARHEARARRSNKMRRVLFYVFLIGASTTLRLYPEMVKAVVLYLEKPRQKTQLAAVQETPHAPGIRQTMPKDRIKVRRGTTRQLESDATDSQAMAKEVEKMLSEMQAGH